MMTKTRDFTTNQKMKYEGEQVWFPLSEDILSWDDDFHELMLRDHLRMVSYEAAIKEVVKPCMTVADIGTGTGILALWALEAGAKHVYGIEANPVRIPQALQRIVNAGYSERFTVHNALSYDVNLQERVDIIISEILGNLGDNEDMTPILADARTRFLKENGKVLPQKVTTYLTPVSSVKAHQQVKDKVCKGINEQYSLSDILRKLGINNQFDLYYDCILPKSTYLSEPQAVKEFNFDANDDSEYQTKIAYLVNKDGILTGFKGHFVAQLSDKVILDISGDDIDRRKTSDCWKHCFLPIESTVEVMQGDVIELDYQRFYPVDRSIPFRQCYSWKGVVKCNGVNIHEFYHGTCKEKFRNMNYDKNLNIANTGNY